MQSRKSLGSSMSPPKLFSCMKILRSGTPPMETSHGRTLNLQFKKCKRTMEETLEELLHLDSTDPVPRVTEQSLETMHDSLVSRLRFPFDAIYSEPTGEETDNEFCVRVQRLLDISEHPVFSSYLGILCESKSETDAEEIVIPLSRITEVEEESTRDVVEAYSTWFWECR